MSEDLFAKFEVVVKALRPRLEGLGFEATDRKRRSFAKTYPNG